MTTAPGRLVGPAPPSLLFAAVGASLLLGSPARPEGTKGRMVWRPRLAIEQAYTDNLTGRAGRGRQEEFFTTLSAGLEVDNPSHTLPARAFLGVRGRVFPDFSEGNFFELRSEAAYRLERTDLSLRYKYSPRRLLFELEEDGGKGVLYARHQVRAKIARKFGRRKRLRLRAVVQSVWRDFILEFRQRDSVAPSAGVNIRYRIGRLFTPQVGFRYATRNARSRNQDRDEIRLSAGFSSELARGIVARFRYRRSWRDYAVGSERNALGKRNNNFGREDRIDQYEAWFGFPLPTCEGLTMRARYKFRQGNSTREGRDFSFHEVGIELSYLLP